MKIEIYLNGDQKQLKIQDNYFLKALVRSSCGELRPLSFILGDARGEFLGERRGDERHGFEALFGAGLLHITHLCAFGQFS